MRLRTVLLTGDAKSVAEDVGRKLGVDKIVSDLLPEGKLQYVKQLTEKGHKVAMVGDGVNDAPALMQASVGVAMGSGTDVARESADVVLIGSDLSKLVETLQIARRCRRIIMQNFVGTLVVDSIGVGLAAFGFLNPVGRLHSRSSEMAFILNSARLLPPVSSANHLFAGFFRSHLPQRMMGKPCRSRELRYMDKFPLTTKRLVMGHASVCQGCCCGNTANGRPPVPVEWLKNEWAGERIVEAHSTVDQRLLGTL